MYIAIRACINNSTTKQPMSKYLIKKNVVAYLGIYTSNHTLYVDTYPYRCVCVLKCKESPFRRKYPIYKSIAYLIAKAKATDNRRRNLIYVLSQKNRVGKANNQTI